MLTEKTFELIPAELGRELKQSFIVSGMCGNLKSPTVILLKRVTTELVDTIIERDELTTSLEKTRPYLEHKIYCLLLVPKAGACTCGLEAALRGEEEKE